NLVKLRRQLMKIEPRRAFRPRMINLTYTIQDNKIKRFMAGVSVSLSPGKPPQLTRSNVATIKKEVAKLRSDKMMIFQGVNRVLTEQELSQCNHSWGNCAESVPWEMMKGQNGHHVDLYSHAIELEEMVVRDPCIMCQRVADSLRLKGVATI